MNVRRLIQALSTFPIDAEVEIATRPEPDQWYEIANVPEAIQMRTNVRGSVVVVINTD